MKSYGINTTNNIKSKEELHLEEFYKLGYTIIENVIDKEDLDKLRSELDLIYSQQEIEIGKENLKYINEQNLARMPFVYSELYVRLLSRKDIINYVEKVLGNFFILHLQNGIINVPNEEHQQSSWHRDLPYQNWTSSEPLGCNLYCCLDDFTSENGATFVLPFSQNFDIAPSEQYMEKNAVQLCASAGSVIFFNSMIFHKAGYNKSTNCVRRGVNQMYVKPIITQQIDIPEMLNNRYSDDPYLSMLFGYKSRLSKSVTEYRQLRINRKKSPR